MLKNLYVLSISINCSKIKKTVEEKKLQKIIPTEKDKNPLLSHENKLSLKSQITIGILSLIGVIGIYNVYNKKSNSPVPVINKILTDKEILTLDNKEIRNILYTYENNNFEKIDFDNINQGTSIILEIKKLHKQFTDTLEKIKKCKFIYVVINSNFVNSSTDIMKDITDIYNKLITEIPNKKPKLIVYEKDLNKIKLNKLLFKNEIKIILEYSTVNQNNLSTLPDNFVNFLKTLNL